MRRIIFILITISTCLFAQTENLQPEFFGFARLTNKWSLDDNQSFFAVSNARLGARGLFSSKVGYRLFVDLARKSKFQFEDTSKTVKSAISNILLDAFISFNPSEWLSISIGQSKIPFSSSNLRTPFNMDYILRPMITRAGPNIRDIGIKAQFKNNIILKNTFSLAVVNGDGDNNFTNDKRMAYILRWMFNAVEPLTFGFNYYLGNLNGSRADIYDLELNLKYKNHTLFGEYVNRKIKEGDLKTRAYFISYQYKFFIEGDWADALKANVRFENYKESDIIKMNITTLGLTLSSISQFNSELKLNYELKTNLNTNQNFSTVLFLVQTMF